LSSDKLLRYTQKEFERKFIVNFKNQEEFKNVTKYIGALNRISGNKYEISTTNYTELKEVTDHSELV
jgi:hypothetical protein